MKINIYELDLSKCGYLNRSKYMIKTLHTKTKENKHIYDKPTL